MDPLSFTASLVTVSGVTIMASKLVYTLREKVENAPKDVGDLLEQLQTFQELLEELKIPLQDLRDDAAAQSNLQLIWGKSVAHMQRDVGNLHTKLSKLELQLKKKYPGSRVLLSARQMLSEKKIIEYQSKIHGHCVVLTCIKGTIHDQKLGRLTQNIIQLGNDNRAGFQTISSQVSQATGHLEAHARVGFSDISSDLKSAKLASDELHRDLQSRMDGHAQRDDSVRKTIDEVRGGQVKTIEMTELGFQAVQSALVTAVSSNREGHESTHAMLRRQETLMQRLGNHLAFGNSSNCVRSSRTRSDTWGPTTPKTTFYWKTRYHSLPIGILRISINQTRRCRGSEESASPESTESNIEVTFVPPKWLTCIAVDYRMNLGYDSIGDRWHWGANLRPLTVNQNPFVIQALRTLDLGAIQKSFREGLIHPTDYVLRWGEDLIPWYRFINWSEVNELNEDCPKTAPVLVYMAENGLPGQDHVFYEISRWLREKRSPTLAEGILKHYIWMYLQRSGNLFTEFFDNFAQQSLPLGFGPGTAGLISESLFHSSGAWTVDELSSFGICFLGAVAQVDSEFRARLKACLASFRSPLLAAGNISGDSLYESTFGIVSVLSHFHRLEKSSSVLFLAALCRTGTPSMLRPFTDIGIDLNASAHYNMLGNAAAVGNLDVVSMLIENGANGALALSSFIDRSKDLPDGLYKHLLELLLENSRPTSFDWLIDDALLSVMESSRALSSHPKAPEILFCREVLSDELINCPCTQHSTCNYMCAAIRNGLDSVVRLLLQHAAYADTKSTWLMYSVERGAASCTETLIQHGADVNFLDGNGRSALQLARSSVNASHPRIYAECEETSWYEREVTAEEDAETLAVVEGNLYLKAQSTKGLEVCGSRCELESQSLNQEGEAIPVARDMLEKALRFLSTCYTPPTHGYRVGPHYRGIGDLWSLSFYEALLMRFFYALSYVLLIAIGILALIRGEKRVRMPSRSILSALALLLLAFIWGFSLQMNLPLKPDDGRSVTTQDS